MGNNKSKVSSIETSSTISIETGSTENSSAETSSTGTSSLLVNSYDNYHEETGNWYYRPIPYSQSTKEEVRPTSSASVDNRNSYHSFGADISSAFGNWPPRLNNESIFPYFLDDYLTDQKEFKDFVQTWYKSACAIIYKAENNKKKVIGTGTCIGLSSKKEKTGSVITARHNFQAIPKKRLFLRFHHYEVQRINANTLQAFEHYLELPVTDINNAKGGLDMGCLLFSIDIPKALIDKYIKFLPISIDEQLLGDGAFGGTLPDGHYTMFHFAYGHPQISVGEKESDGDDFSLHDDINIKAGPGASGATVILETLDEGPIGMGISICRIDDLSDFNNVEPNNSSMSHINFEKYINRRLIPFSKYRNPGWYDKVIMPYSHNPKFQPIPIEALDRSGYEFLRWRTEAFVKIGEIEERPEHRAYTVSQGQSNHHIIPKYDLAYLWNYFHSLGPNEINVVRARIKPVLKRFIERENLRIANDVAGYPRQQMLTRKKNLEERLETRIIEEDNRLYREEYNRVVIEKYAQFYAIIAALCFPLGASKRNFAWGFWNLFKGPNSEHRDDDPKDDAVMDRSEKKSPLGFPMPLWSALKDSNIGLYRQICMLKNLKEDDTQAQAQEGRVMGTLRHIANIWRDSHRNNAVNANIYPYNSQEWEQVGRRDGRNIYKLK